MIFQRLSHCLSGAVSVVLVSCVMLASAQAQTMPRPLIQEGTRHVTQDEAGVYKIDDKASRIDTQPIAITGGSRYVLSLDVRLDSDFVMEKNDRAHHLAVTSFRYGPASRYNIRFLDKDNNEINAFGFGQSGFFLTQQWHTYAAAFYTPANATSMVVRFEPAKQATYIRQFKVTELKDHPEINLNPDFRYGELSYSGWQPARDGRLVTRPDGVVVFRPGYGGTSGVFPLEANVTYHVTAKGTGGGSINMTYYDENGKQIVRRFLTRPSDKGEAVVEFIPPEGARYGSLVLYGVTALEACRIVKAPSTN